jgi:hypothetical protein
MMPQSVRPRDPAYARFASFGGYKSAEAWSAKAERGDPVLTCPDVLDARFRGHERSV